MIDLSRGTCEVGVVSAPVSAVRAVADWVERRQIQMESSLDMGEGGGL